MVPGLLAPRHRGQQEGGLANKVWPSCCLHKVLRKVLPEEMVLEAFQIFSSFCSIGHVALFETATVKFSLPPTLHSCNLFPTLH